MFTTDSRAERWLDLIGTQTKYRMDLTFAMLAPDWLRKNFGRSSACVKAAIDEYGARTDAGSSPPAPILWFNEKGFAEVLDGVQRIAMAQERNPKFFSAYVVKCTPIVAMQIRVFANIALLGGHQDPAEWTLEKAVTLLVLPGDMTPEDCAIMGGWKVAAVKNKIKIIECQQAIEATGGAKLKECVVKIIADYANKSDFEAAPGPIAKFTHSLARGQYTADEAPPHVESFFKINRGRGKVFNQLEDNLRTFLKAEQARINDPKRVRAQTMSAEGRINQVLTSAITTTQKIIDADEAVFGVEKFFKLVNDIRSNLQQIQKQSRHK